MLQLALFALLWLSQFVEDFRILHGSRATTPSRSRLISLKVPEDLLEAFKTRAQLSGRPYQTVIKELMRSWLLRE